MLQALLYTATCSILIGYVLVERTVLPQKLSSSGGWLAAWLGCAGVGALVFALVWWSRRNPHTTRRSALQAVVWALILSVSCGLYGGWKALVCPTEPWSWLGQSVEVEGRIAGVYPNKHGGIAIVTIDKVLLDQTWHKCQVRAAWRLSRKNAASIQAGVSVVLQGILAQPFSAPTASAKPVIPLQPATFQFVGQIIQQTTSGRSFGIRWKATWFQDAAASSTMPQGQQTLAESIVFGGSSLDASVKQEFLAAGVTHVLAASGSNILFLEVALESFVYPLWRRLRLPYGLWSMTMIGVAWTFACICGGQPSIVRAAMMSTYRWGGRAFGRRASVSTGVALAATFMAVVAPLTMTTPSAWLSFVATAVMAHGLGLNQGHSATELRLLGNRYAAAPWHRFLTGSFGPRWLQAVMHFNLRGLRRVWMIARMTLYIELWLAPIVLWLFAQITPYGVIANVVCEPLLAMLLPVTILWITLAVLSHAAGFIEPLTTIAAQVVHLLVSLLETVVHTIATLPGALWQVSVVPNLAIAFYYAALCSSIYVYRRWRNSRMFP